MKKISIIIPNFNGEQFLERCLNSIIEQDYRNLEIIIVDDGSTDKSLNIIQKFIEEHKESNFFILTQNNMNGAIARNHGLSIATGEYILFLDSDDMLSSNVLKRMIKELEKSDADLLIGNYELINESDSIIGKKELFKKNKEYEGIEKIYNNVSNISPVPSNKIYKSNIIKNNNLIWGNVRIGQDLNFYLKYLVNCKKVITINDNIYKYRIVDSSISRTYDFKIFDITESFKDIKKYYYNTNKKEIYDKYIPIIQVVHYNIQISKIRFFKKISDKYLILNYFKNMTNKIDFSNCDNTETLSSNLKKIFFKTHFRLLYITLLFFWRKK